MLRRVAEDRCRQATAAGVMRREAAIHARAVGQQLMALSGAGHGSGRGAVSANKVACAAMTSAAAAGEASMHCKQKLHALYITTSSFGFMQTTGG